MSDLGNARLTTEVDLSGLEKGLSEAEGQTKSRLGGLADTLKGGLGFAFLGLGAAAVGGFGAAAGAGLGFNNAMEQARARINAFTKDAGATEEILGMVADRASRTPFAFEEMAGAAASLGPVAESAGVDLEGLIAQAEILAASNPAEGLEGAAFALKEAAGGDFASAIERFNLSRQYINQLKEEGVPSLEILSRAMTQAGYDTDLVSQLANTAQGRWSTFTDTLTTVAGQATQPIFDALSGGLAIVNDTLAANQPMLTALGETLAGWVSQAIQGVITLFQTWGPVVSEIMMQIMGAVGPAVAFIAGLLSGEGTTSLGTWGLAFQNAQALIQGVMTAIMGIVGPILAILSAFWAQHGTEIVAFATQAWNQIGSIVAGILAILQATIIPILTGIGGFIASHSAEIQTVLSAAWTIIETLIGTALANIQSIINIVLAAINGDWGRVWTEIQAIAQRSIQAVQTVVGSALSAIQSVWGSTLSGLQSKATEVWDGIKNKIGEALEGAKTKINEVLSGIKGDFESKIGGALEYVQGLPAKFKSAGEAMINSLREGVMGTINKLIEDAKKALQQLADLLPGSEPKDPTSPLAHLGRRGEAFVANFADPLLAGLEGLNLRPALAGLGGQLDAAMTGPLAGAASARAEADVSVRLNEGGLRGLIDVQVDKKLTATGRDVETRRRTG